MVVPRLAIPCWLLQGTTEPIFVVSSAASPRCSSSNKLAHSSTAQRDPPPFTHLPPEPNYSPCSTLKSHHPLFSPIEPPLLLLTPEPYHPFLLPSVGPITFIFPFIYLILSLLLLYSTRLITFIFSLNPNTPLVQLSLTAPPPSLATSSLRQPHVS